MKVFCGLTLPICCGILATAFVILNKVENLVCPEPNDTQVIENECPVTEENAPVVDVSLKPVEIKAATSPKPKAKSNLKMCVSQEYDLNDRYRDNSDYDRDYLPTHLGETEGIVVLNISVSPIGDVVSTSVNSKTTITDEKVILEARRAALKTSFNYRANPYSNQNGTITYEYSRK